GAHNPEKMAALGKSLEAISASDQSRQIVVLSLLASKQADAILEQLAPITDTLITTATSIPGKPSMPPEDLASLARGRGIADVRVGGKPLDALRQALHSASPQDSILVTGSLFLVGAVRSYWYPIEQIVSQRTSFPD
ncbi:MAG: bifunctional folylpolyglutamate synthase/dihydrofolate synthase, partial [Chloroflexi bacterium]|nr:bifunctional folylpolyglutamate synthase/dihydrofolate synthase [Chloroflexota bacterium]